MTARYSSRFIDQLFEDQDLSTLHQVIEVVYQTRTLPEEFWLFCRIFEWAPSRSGVWQYYEGLRAEKGERIAAALHRLGFRDIEQRYRSGFNAASDARKMTTLDAWLADNAQDIHARILALIRPHRDLLKA